MKNILIERARWLKGILFSNTGCEISWRSWCLGYFFAHMLVWLMRSLKDGGPVPFLLLLLFSASVKLIYSYKPYAKPDVRPPGSDPS